jgi:hypothetical protein
VSNFHTGSKMMVIAHTEGIFSNGDIIRTYCGIVEQMDHNQPTRVENDIAWLKELKEGEKYFFCIRQRTGPQSEYNTVNLKEFNIQGRYEPIWESEFIIWDQNFASATSEFLAGGGFNGEEKEEVTECQ